MLKKSASIFIVFLILGCASFSTMASNLEQDLPNNPLLYRRVQSSHSNDQYFSTMLWMKKVLTPLPVQIQAALLAGGVAAVGIEIFLKRR